MNNRTLTEKKFRARFRAEVVKKYLSDRHYRLTKISYCRKYVSRTCFNESNIEEYHGRYGDGIKIYLPCDGSTRYSYVYYYVNDGKTIITPYEMVYSISIALF